MEEEFEIQDIENYSSGKNEQFSHQILVMSSMKKCIDAGSKEMRSGWVNQKIDSQGNVIMQYIEDTRMQFIETVETCECIMICDFDGEARKNIKELKASLKKKYKSLCELEEADWINLNVRSKHERVAQGIILMKGYLSKNLPFYQEYLGASVKVHRNILKELTKLTDRLEFYEIRGIGA